MKVFKEITRLTLAQPANIIPGQSCKSMKRRKEKRISFNVMIMIAGDYNKSTIMNAKINDTGKKEWLQE